MRQNQTIISISETLCGASDAHQVHQFDSPDKARDFIDSKLKETLQLVRKDLPELEIKATEGNIRDMWSRKEGTFGYAIGSRGFDIAFLNVPAEYNVSDDEVVRTLDAFCNSNRSRDDFRRIAEGISGNMHRYIQSELWKFVKELIRAFAKGRYDDRNKSAHHQAQDMETFMEERDF